MTTEEEGKTLANQIVEESKKGNLVLYVQDEAILQGIAQTAGQPLMGLLWDLGLTPEELLPQIRAFEPRAVNDYATMLVISELKSKIHKLEKQLEEK